MKDNNPDKKQIITGTGDNKTVFTEKTEILLSGDPVSEKKEKKKKEQNRIDE